MQVRQKSSSAKIALRALLTRHNGAQRLSEWGWLTAHYSQNFVCYTLNAHFKGSAFGGRHQISSNGHSKRREYEQPNGRFHL